MSGGEVNAYVAGPRAVGRVEWLNGHAGARYGAWG